MGAAVLGEIPDPDAAGPVAADDLALVRVDDDVVRGAAVVVAALDGAAAGLPDLDGAVLGARDHPLALAVEGDAGDVARVALECEQGVRVGRLDVEELDRVVAGGGEEALVGRDAQAVDLRVRVLDRAGADARESLPEPGEINRKGQSTLEHREGGGGGDEDAREVAGGLPYRVVVASCESEVSPRVVPLRRRERGERPRPGPGIAYRCRE